MGARGNASEDSWQKRVRRKWLCELSTSQEAEKQKLNHTGYRAIFNLGVFTPCPQCSGQCNSRMNTVRALDPGQKRRQV